MSKIHNFSAGPGILPPEVLKQASEACINFDNMNLSLLEISHRSKNYVAKRRNPITGEMEEQFLDSSKSAKTQEATLNYSIEEMKYKKECQKNHLVMFGN
jgi:hypothetical protein